MGFPAGFVCLKTFMAIETMLIMLIQLGGFTLTASILYLSAILHKRNRLTQSQSLIQQNLILSSIVEPLPTAEPPREIEHVSLKESVKDQWNREVEGMVRRVQNTDWNKVGEDLVDGTTRLWSRAVSAVKDTGKDS